MPELQIDLLYLMAEVSIATVALSGITMVLSVSNTEMTRAQVAQITLQLRMASMVTAFSILPLVMSHYAIEPEILWRVACGLYLVTVLITISVQLYRRSQSELPPSMYRFFAIPAISTMTMLPTGLWLGAAWPYLTQLFIAWLVSLILFLVLIHEILSDRAHPKDKAGV